MMSVHIYTSYRTPVRMAMLDHYRKLQDVLLSTMIICLVESISAHINWPMHTQHLNHTNTKNTALNCATME